MADDTNIGASRLLGTNGLQQAVDSLGTQVNKLTSAVSSLSSNMGKTQGGGGGGTTGMSTGSGSGSSWNTRSNRASYGSNGGGGSFSGFGGGSRAGGRASNGGGASFSRGTRFAGIAGAVTGVAAGLTAYGNSNMSDFMQADMFGMQQAQLGGIGSGGAQQASAAARKVQFGSNYLALNASDAARAGYMNVFTSGFAAQSNGGANPAYVNFNNQVQGFGYLSPTLGATGAAQAAADTYSNRAALMSTALGLPSTLGRNGVQTPMGQIARAIMAKSLRPGQSYNTNNMAAALGQNSGLTANLNYYGQQMGWSQSTIQEYRNYMQGLVTAQSKGMSNDQFDSLISQAQGGSSFARNKLKIVGVDSSMFETQRDLNSTRMSRQNDILNSMAPAFDKATDSINKFSQALTSFLQQTGLDKAIGTGAGWSSAISNSLGGFSGAFGAAGGVATAMRLFGGGGGGFSGLGGLFRGFGGGGGGAARGAGGLLNATRGANGVYNITSLGGEAAGGTSLASLGILGAAGIGTAAAGYAGWNSAVSGKGFGGFMAKVPAAFGVFGAAANVGQGTHKLLDKLTGKNQQSWWDVFMPGGEKRSTPTNQSGGGSNAVAGGGGSNGASNMGASAAAIIKFAESQLGVPYLWGGESPGKGMDCSGLMQWAFGQAGVSLPRTSQDQQNAGTSIPVNQSQAGDLLFVGKPAHHVVMNIGNGQIIEAPHTGANVRTRSFNPSEFTSAARIVNNTGNLNSLLNNNSAGNTNTLNNQQNTSGGNTGSYGGTSEASILASALASSVGSMPLNSGAQNTGSTSGTGATGSTPTANGRNDKGSLQAYAKQLLAKYGWAGEWDSFNNLVNSESSWNYQATNPTSGAYGIAQALPASKYASSGSDWKTNGDTQLSWMMDYIKGRYGDPNAAWSFHQKNNWYANGAWSIDKDQKATVHQGEMIIPAKQAETIRQALLNNSFNPNVQKNAAGNGGGLYIGAINVQMPNGYTGSATDSQMAGKAVVDAIVNDTRIKNLQIGQ